MDITSIYRSSLKTTNLYSGRNNIGKAYRNGILIYLRPKYKEGFDITYKVDSSTEYTELVASGASVLSPTTFTPTKSGYTFVGWKEDTTANSSVLTSKTADSDITLYAVFSKGVTLTYYDNSTTAKSHAGSIYYNNGKVNNPSFTMTQASASGWSARGWSTTNAGNTTITHNNGATITLTGDLTIYGLYERTLTLTYYDNSTTAKTKTGTQYWAPAGYINPSFTMTQAASTDGFTTRGWSTTNKGNATVNYSNGATITLTDNLTIYGLYQKTITVTYYNNSSSASKATGTRYWAPAGYINPSFTLSQASKSGWSARGWSTSNSGSAGITYNNGATFTRDSDVTLYGLYSASITLSYNGNGATGGSTASQSGTIYWAPAGTIGATFSLRSNGFSRSYYYFSSWSVNGSNYSAGATITLTSSTTAYANWGKSYSARTCSITDLSDITSNISSYVVLGTDFTSSPEYEWCTRSNGSGNAIEFIGNNGAQIKANCPCTVTVTYNYNLYAWDGADDWYIWRAYAYKNSSAVQELFYRGGQKSGGGFFTSGTASCTVNLAAGETFSIRMIGGGSQSGTPTGRRSKFHGTVSFVGTPNCY